MTKRLKTPQIAANGFMGYGGCNPPCRQLPLVPSRSNSRALTWRYALKVVARHADGFGFGLGFTGFSQIRDVARQRGGFVSGCFQTCSASTTASNSQNWENQNHTKNLYKPINTTTLSK